MKAIMIASRELIQKVLSDEKFDCKEGVRKIAEHFDSKKAFSSSSNSGYDPVWQISQCKSIFMMRLFQIGVEKERIEDVTALCEQLYSDSLLTKQQIRRGLVRLCSHFCEMVEPDNPLAIMHIAQLLVTMRACNMISGRTLTMLPASFLANKLMAVRDQLGSELGKEFDIVVSDRKTYRQRINELLLSYFSTEIPGLDNKDSSQSAQKKRD